jgi:hypothetical protein
MSANGEDFFFKLHRNTICIRIVLLRDRSLIARNTSLRF